MGQRNGRAESKGDGIVIAGQVTVTDKRASAPAYLDEELSMPEMVGSAKLSAVTDQTEGSPMVAITNISSETQHVAIHCIRDGKSPMVSHVEIAAHATSTSEPCSNLARATFAEYISSIEAGSSQGVYGIELEGDGDPGSLAAFAIAPHYRGRDLVFSSVPFYDPQTIHSSDVVFAGVPIGVQDTLPDGLYIPRLSLANFSDSPLEFSVYLADTTVSRAKGADGSSSPPPLNMIHTGMISPHRTGEYVFSGQEAQSGLLHSIVVSTKSSPGAFEAKLVSRSNGRLYQVELLAKDSLEMNNSGVHPWTLQEDTESHVILFNHSKSDKKVGVFINSGETLWSSEMVLAASETREVSINKLQNDKIRDDHGRLLPSSAKEGVVDWMTPESGDVTGRLMVTSRDTDLARNFSCGTYKSECQLAFDTFANDITIDDLLEMYEANADVCINSQPLQCSNATTTNGTVNYNWNVGATNIIALNAPTEQTKQGPMLKGVSGGNGTATVTAEAGACQSTGSGNPTVGCPAPPTADTISVSGAYSTTQTTFQGQLSGGSGTFAGWQVSEYSQQAGEDGCSQSAQLNPTLVPPNSKMVVTGTVGTVSSNNTYSDAVGWYPASVTYIRNNSPLQSNTPLIPQFPCGASVNQVLTALCPKGDPATDQAVIEADSSNTLTETVYSTYVTNCKRGTCNTLNH